MKVTFSGKQVDVSEKLRKHVEEAIVNSVEKYFSAPISCSVAFSKEGEDFGAEITVHPAKNIVLKGVVLLLTHILLLTMQTNTLLQDYVVTKQNLALTRAKLVWQNLHMKQFYH